MTAPSHPPRSTATRWTARLGLAGVSAIAAVVSYFHALAVVQAAGAAPPVSYLVPFLADLVILGASAALLDASKQGLGRPALATVALVTGIGVTLAMNVAAGWDRGLAGALVAGWPALAFILALESLAAILRSGRGPGDHVPADGVPAAFAHGDPPEPPDTMEALRLLLETGSQRRLAESLGVTKARVQAWSAITKQVEVTPAGSFPPAGQPGQAGGQDSPELRAALAAPNGQAGHGRR